MERRGHDAEGPEGPEGPDEAGLEWARFERRLADRLVALDDDEIVRLEPMVGVGHDDLAGAAPYVQLMGSGEEQLRAEVCGNHYLDVRFELDAEQHERLVEVGWRPPTTGRDVGAADAVDEVDGGEHNFSLDAEARDADRVAMMVVVALREAFGCPHPSFVLGDLDRSGYEVGAEAAEAAEGDDHGAGSHDFDVWGCPRSRGELRELIDLALAGYFEHEVQHDDDGDVPVICGEWVLDVRAMPGRPAIELSAVLVVEPTDRERLALELDLLNRTHPMASFFTLDDTVVMRHVLLATPFVSDQLRACLGQLTGAVEELATALIGRVGGRSPLEEHRRREHERAVLARDLSSIHATRQHAPVMGEQVEASGALLALLELLHLGEVGPAEVAALFDHDRHALVLQLVALRTGRQACVEHDVDLVLHLLRRALRHVVEQEARGVSTRERAHSHQLSLLAGVDPDQPSLDAGEWGREVG